MLLSPGARRVGLKPRDTTSTKRKAKDCWPSWFLEEKLITGESMTTKHCPDGKFFYCVPCAQSSKLTTGKLNMRRPFDLHRWNVHKSTSVTHNRAIKNIEAEEEQRQKKIKKGVIVSEEKKRKAQSEMGAFFAVIKKSKTTRGETEAASDLTIAVTPASYVPPRPV